jgi:hypothetical protein
MGGAILAVPCQSHAIAAPRLDAPAVHVPTKTNNHNQLQESARLEKMLSSGSVHASKVEEMARKTSVLAILKGGEEE